MLFLRCPGGSLPVRDGVLQEAHSETDFCTWDVYGEGAGEGGEGEVILLESAVESSDKK